MWIQAKSVRVCLHAVVIGMSATAAGNHSYTSIELYYWFCNSRGIQLLPQQIFSITDKTQSDLTSELQFCLFQYAYRMF